MNPINPNLVAVEDSKNLDELIDSENIALALRAYLEKDKRIHPRDLRIDLIARRLMSHAAAWIEKHEPPVPEPGGAKVVPASQLRLDPDWQARFWELLEKFERAMAMNERLLDKLEKRQ